MSILTDSSFKAFRAAQATKLASIFSTWRTTRPVNILNPALCEKALDKLDLSAYKNSIIIDMNPGIALWSAALHDRLQPRQHILLEPEKKYKPYLEEFTKKYQNAYWVPEDGYNWSTYFRLFEPNPPSPPWPKDIPPFDPRHVPPEEGVNTDLLFTGNLSSTNIASDRLIAQFVGACAHGRWVQKYGRVRFLLWMQDSIKVRYVPRGLGGRVRATVMADTLCEVQEVASSNEILQGKGHPRITLLVKDKDGNMVLDEPEPPRPPGRPEKKKQVEGEGEVEGEEGETPSAEKKKREKGKPSHITLTDIEEKLEKIERSRYDTSVAEELKAELQKEKRGRPAKAERPGRPKPRNTPALTPEIERLRKKLLKLQKIGNMSTGGELPTLMRKLNQIERSQEKTKLKLEGQLEEHFSDSEVSDKWLVGMEHPPWYYRDKIPSLAESILATKKKFSLPFRGGSTIRQVNSKATIEGLSALERPEEVEPPKNTEKGKEYYQEYKNQWEKKTDGALAVASKEDEIIGFEKKLLQYHNRKFDSVTVDAEDFWPNVPLALVDFTPKHLHPHLRNPDPAARETHWETYNWMLCSLFALRAHGVGSALNTLVPGGAHLLDCIDPNEAKIDPMQRIRTLTLDDLVAITKAWEAWPFRVENAHLEQFMGDEEREDGKRPKVKNIKS